MHLKSMQILVLGYVCIIIVGAFILLLPGMHTTPITFLEALFTSASAFTCTGLIIKDTAVDFTILGQSVIIVLIWFGGFGYMSLLGIVYVLLRRRLSHMELNMIKGALNHPSVDGMTHFLKKILVFVLILEGVGALVLFIYFYYCKDFDVGKAAFAGIFHAISALNNAGFSIFSTNLMDYRQSLVVNFVICSLVICGSLGYIVLVELHAFTHSYFSNFVRACIHKCDMVKIRLSLHTRIVATYTIGLLLIGFCFVLLLEYNNAKTLGSFTFFDKALSSFFISVNYRTSGFNTIDLSGLKDSTLFFSSLLMLVGGAPGGSAGGIKVTTLAVLLAFCIALFNDAKPALFKRAISESSIKKAIVVAIIALFSIVITSFCIAIFQEDTRFMLIMFEVCSAFATVGVSTGNGGTLSLSANFNFFSQLCIIALMIMGKVGILAFWLICVGKRKQSHIALQEENVII